MNVQTIDAFSNRLLNIDFKPLTGDVNTDIIISFSPLLINRLERKLFPTVKRSLRFKPE